MTSLMCLALAVYFEAGNQDTDAMAAVAAVVENRVDDRRYPDTTCDVVYEPGQFEWTFDGKPDRPGNDAPSQHAWKQAVGVAKREIAGKGLGITSTHFHTLGHKLPWADAFTFDGMYGGNVFYTNNTPWR